MEVVAAEWACMFLSAAAFLAVVIHDCVAVNVRFQNVLVVAVYDLFHVFRAAITYLDGVSVE